MYVLKNKNILCRFVLFSNNRALQLSPTDVVEIFKKNKR